MPETARRSGFAFWPLGWLLTVGNIDAHDNIIDVSGWTELDYNDKTAVTIAVPCQWAVSPYPGDFRSPGEIFGEAWTVATNRHRITVGLVQASKTSSVSG